MVLVEKSTRHLVEVLDLSALFNPCDTRVAARRLYGEEAQDPEPFRKADLDFPSGEALPRCWTDPHYRDDRIRRMPRP
ncbi:MAG TPA: acetyltransferase [Gammaproteobacteria bacterium]